jgi:hypothetical protein
MANPKHLNMLKQGVDAWNQWRHTHLDIQPNLFEASLRGSQFQGIDLSGADLRGATLREAELSGSNLQGADLRGAHLRATQLCGANLRSADLRWTNLSEADLRQADLTGCAIYATSAWNVKLAGTIQSNLVITNPSGSNETTITVDNLEVAQFIYLLLNNEKIRDVIDTITSKVVLILGRFTDERKKVLDALREELRQYNYLPVLFDFDEPAHLDVTETVTTLARLSRFIIADITDPRSIPQELAFIVPELPSVPVQPLLESSQREFGMFAYFTRFPWVLPLYHYTDQASLLSSLKEKVIDPAEQMVKNVTKRE